jgi:16S rRNA processing protein RimM
MNQRAANGRGHGKVVVAVITAAHGIKGEVKVKSLTSTPQAFAAYGPLQAANGRVFEITKSRPAKDDFICTLKTVTDRNAAEALRGTELFVDRSRLPQTSDEDLYAHDLIGLRVLLDTGVELGTLVDVPNYGATDLLEVERPGHRDTVLIPYAGSYIVSADLEKGIITVTLPEGYLNDAKPEKDEQQ